MNVSDIIAEILVEAKKFNNREDAKQAILQTFKKEYPYWSYSQWDEPLPEPLSHVLAKTLRSYHTNEIKDLIIDLPVMLAKFRGS